MATAVQQAIIRLRRIHIVWALLVITPSILILALGILVLVFGQRALEYVWGSLILCFAATLVAGVIALLAYIRREAAVAQLQTEFVSKVSHDLRTPLTSIRMFVETLKMGRAGDAATVQQCLDTMTAETQRLTALIDRLLDWARMEAGKKIYEPQPEPVEDLVDAALEAFEPQLLVHPAEVIRDIPSGLPKIDVDLAAMSEALLNLLQNAHRYSGDAKVITVRAAVKGPNVEIRIEDNGPGIPTNEQPKIFEKFYRARDAIVRNIPGTGLGLSMVQHIVEGHQGTVTLKSQPGKGSAFIITLPALVAA
jgi:two-component system, OmpR family, phosphate regulon sensor histidine kinase PhoR